MTRFLSSLILVGTWVLALSACPQKIVGGTSCTGDQDCPVGELCVDGACFGGRGNDGGVTVACNSDSQCQAINPDFVCNSVGLCELPSTGGPCTAIANCPIDQFCNFQSQVCTALQAGFCREASQCSANTKCSATPGGMGRCVECLSGGDCASGNCLSNGTCATAAESCDPPCQTGYSCNRGQCVQVSGDCNPPCLNGEQCNQGVCYGANGCPRNAHEVNGQCACDDGYVPNSSGNACVPEGQSCDPQSQQACQQQGGTWDAVNCVCLSGGSCDPPCPAGTSCQNNTCIAVAGSCTSSLDCLMAGGSSFMTCDSASQTCVCNALQGMIMCLLFAGDFDPDICDCVYNSEPDAGVTPDAAIPDSAMPDHAAADSAALDAGVVDHALPDSAAGSDAGGVADGGVTGACAVSCSAPSPVCVEGQCVACAGDSDCGTGLCDLADHSCKEVSCIYDHHCQSSAAPHCGASYSCVGAHDCGSDMGFIPYPWDDSMTVSVEGDTSSAYSNWGPGGSCGQADGPEDIYAFALVRVPLQLTVTMEALPLSSSWDTHPYIADGICGGSNLACHDLYPADQPETMILSTFYSSNVTIVADGYASSDSGPYRLTIIVDECDSVSDCAANEVCLNGVAKNSRCKAQ